MKVLLRRNVLNLGKIGEVVEVKPGYARNFLLPQHLATAPSAANLKAVEAEKEEYLKELTRQKAQLEAKAAVVQGKEITISARANEEGHLYGSVGPAQIVAVLAAEGIFIEAEHIVMSEPIRTLDKYDLKVRFSEDVIATIHVWIVPIRDLAEEAERAERDKAQAKAEKEAERRD
jgi:large subunit ribosomal protein L9